MKVKFVRCCDCIICQIERQERQAMAKAMADATDRAMMKLYADYRPKRRRSAMTNRAKVLLAALLTVMAGTIFTQMRVSSYQNWMIGELQRSNEDLFKHYREAIKRIKALEERRAPFRVVKASWYGDWEERAGNRTASGEMFRRDAYTVAHRTLPFGTILLIENPENGRMVPAVVNDRGPYIEGRQLDVTEALAHRLGFHRKGVTEVRIYTVYQPGEIYEGQEGCD